MACEYGLVSVQYIEQNLFMLFKIQELHSRGLLKAVMIYSYKKLCSLCGVLTRVSCDGFLIHVQV